MEIAANAPVSSLTSSATGDSRVSSNGNEGAWAGLDRARVGHALKFAKPEERKILLDSTHELSRAADLGLHCLFPTAESPQYRTFFEPSVRDTTFVLVRAMFFASFALQHNRMADTNAKNMIPDDRRRGKSRVPRQTHKKSTPKVSLSRMYSTA